VFCFDSVSPVDSVSEWHRCLNDLFYFDKASKWDFVTSLMWKEQFILTRLIGCLPNLPSTLGHVHDTKLHTSLVRWALV
jgi:hypothetical protein